MYTIYEHAKNIPDPSVPQANEDNKLDPGRDVLNPKLIDFLS